MMAEASKRTTRTRTPNPHQSTPSSSFSFKSSRLMLCDHLPRNSSCGVTSTVVPTDDGDRKLSSPPALALQDHIATQHLLHSLHVESPSEEDREETAVSGNNYTSSCLRTAEVKQPTGRRMPSGMTLFIGLVFMLGGMTPVHCRLTSIYGSVPVYEDWGHGGNRVVAEYVPAVDNASAEWKSRLARFMERFETFHGEIAGSFLRTIGSDRSRRHVDRLTIRQLVEDECNSTLTACRQAVVNQAVQVCGGVPDDLALIQGHIHSPEPGRGFLRGLNSLAGSPNNWEVLMDHDNLSWSETSDWMKGYGKQALWFWYIWLSLGVCYLIFLLSWSGGLCSVKCRNRYGACFREQCCHERERVAPIQNVEQRKTRCITGWYASFPFIWTVAFIAVSVIYGAFLFKSPEQSTCAIWRAATAVMFGDTEWETANPLFVGTASLNDTFETSAQQFETYRQEAVVLSNTIATTVRQEMADRIEIINPWQQAMEDTMAELDDATGPRFDYEFWDGTFGSPMPGGAMPSMQFCFACTINDAFKLSQADVDAIKVDLDGSIADLVDGLSDYDTLTMQPSVDTLGTLMGPSVLNVDGLNDNIIKMLDALAVEEPRISSISTGTASIFLIVPCLVFLLWVAGLAIFFRLAWLHVKRRDPNPKNMRNWFACSCAFFGCASFLLYFFGVAVLAITQPAAELWYFTDTQLMTNNKYLDYPFFQNQFNQMNFSNLTKECGTFGPKSGMLDALALDVPGLQRLPFVGTQLRDLTAEGRSTLSENVENVQQTYFQSMKAEFDHALPLVATQLSPVIIDMTRYAMFRELLYGHMGVEDRPIATADMQLLADAIEADAVAGISSLDYLPFNGEPPMTVAEFEAEVADPTQFYGLDAQIKRLEDFMAEIGNPMTFCIDIDTPCCQGPEPCEEINGMKNVAYIYGVAGEVLVRESMTTSTNRMPNVDVLGLVAAHVDNNPAKRHEAVMFTNSIYMLAIRQRARREAGLFKMIDPTDLSASVDVNYPEFERRLNAAWESIYHMTQPLETFVAATDDLLALADEGDDLFETVDGPLDCGYAFDHVAAALQINFEVAAADLGLSGLWWIMMAIGTFVGMILSWRIFHYFADRCNEDLEDELDKEKYMDPLRLIKACREGDLREVVKCCKFQDPTAVYEGSNGCLHLAAYFGNGECVAVCRHLLDKKCDPNAKNGNGYTPLETATTQGFQDIVEVLIKGGGNVRSTDPFGDTTIHNAARVGDEGIVSVLLEGEVRNMVNGPPRNLDNETPQLTSQKAERARVTSVLTQFYEGKSGDLRPTAKRKAKADTSISSFEDLTDNEV